MGSGLGFAKKRFWRRWRYRLALTRGFARAAGKSRLRVEEIRYQISAIRKRGVATRKKVTSGPPKAGVASEEAKSRSLARRGGLGTTGTDWAMVMGRLVMGLGKASPLKG